MRPKARDVGDSKQEKREKRGERLCRGVGRIRMKRLPG